MPADPAMRDDRPRCAERAQCEHEDLPRRFDLYRLPVIGEKASRMILAAA
jgi:hypothetical protein